MRYGFVSTCRDTALVRPNFKRGMEMTYPEIRCCRPGLVAAVLAVAIVAGASASAQDLPRYDIAGFRDALHRRLRLLRPPAP